MQEALERLPRIQTFKYYDPEPSESQVEFRLIYSGRLPPEKWSYKNDYARAVDKHTLRKTFHPQLRELHKQHPDLHRQAETKVIVEPGGLANRVRLAVPGHPGKTWVEHIADNFQRCGGRFVPLVREASGLTCSLDILFLRRDNPGGLVENGGDIDSRVKVLFDGLKMPTDVAELGGLKIEEDENPFFCLLEDDKLITRMPVITDRLIIPPKSDENLHDVFLVVHVTLIDPGALFAHNAIV